MSSLRRNYGPVIFLVDGHQADASCQSCRCHSIRLSTRNIHFSAIFQTFFTQEDIIMPYSGICCLLLTRNRRSPRYISLLPKRLSRSYISLQIEHRAKINSGMRFNTILKWKMTLLICLTTKCRNIYSNMMVKKKY